MNVNFKIKINSKVKINIKVNIKKIKQINFYRDPKHLLWLWIFHGLFLWDAGL
jgi:ribosomal protein S13